MIPINFNINIHFFNELHLEMIHNTTPLSRMAVRENTRFSIDISIEESVCKNIEESSELF